MSKNLIVGVVVFAMLFSSGCSRGTDTSGGTELGAALAEKEVAVSSLQANVDRLESARVDLAQQVEDQSKENAKVKGEKTVLELELDGVKTELEGLKTEYAAYKERMKPYEELDTAEAEARKIEADRLAAEKKAADEKAAADAAAAAEAEAKQGYETGITFSQLARTPDEYVGKKIKLSGKVIQVIEGTSSNNLRIAIDDDYDQVILVEYFPSIVAQRVLEDDMITIYGVSMGTHTYKSTMGGMITVPYAFVDRIDFN